MKKAQILFLIVLAVLTGLNIYSLFSRKNLLSGQASLIYQNGYVKRVLDEAEGIEYTDSLNEQRAAEFVKKFW